MKLFARVGHVAALVVLLAAGNTGVQQTLSVGRDYTKVSPAQFQIFDLYVIREWPILRVTETLGINCGQVYLAKHRITMLLRAEVQRLDQNFSLLQIN